MESNPSIPPAAKKPKHQHHNHEKLTCLPPTHRISKRPLLHAPIPSPRTSSVSPKIIYISTSSPFIAIIKRVRKLLDFVEGRASGDVVLTRDGRSVMKKIEEGISGRGGRSGGRGGGSLGGGKGNAKPRDEEIQLRATGRAIQKALQIAIRLQGEEGLRVRFETASVGAVDDVVERTNPKSVQNKGGRKGDTVADENSKGEGEAMNIDDAGEEEEKEEEEGVDVEASRVRRVSCLIIFVGLK